MAYFTQAGHGQSYSNGAEGQTGAPSRQASDAAPAAGSDGRHVFGQPQPVTAPAQREPQQPHPSQFQPAQPSPVATTHVFAQQPAAPFQPRHDDARDDAQSGMAQSGMAAPSPFTPAAPSWQRPQAPQVAQGATHTDYFAQPHAQSHSRAGTDPRLAHGAGDAQDAYTGPGMGLGTAYDPQGYVPETPAGKGGGYGNTLRSLGAVASLALVVGIGLWGYQLISRDVSGVPVVRAVEGPLRIQPEDPGGRQADHQGLAVNAVAATGNVERPADRLTLAPPSLSLSEDDQPVRAATDVSATGADPQNGEPASTLASGEAVAAYQGGEIDALVAELTAGVQPLDGAGTASAPTPASVQAALTAAIDTANTNSLSGNLAVTSPAIVQPEPLQPVTVAAVAPATNQITNQSEAASQTSAAALALRNAPGVRVSLRPATRPARFTPAPASTQAASRATQDVSPDSLPAGTRLAQLGAYESAEVARAEWDRIAGRFGDYLEGKKRVVQRAESGGRTFYRLRAMGFADLSDARRFCSALVAGNADCIPVTTR